MVRNCVTALCKISDLQNRAGSLPALPLISNQGCKGKTKYVRVQQYSFFFFNLKCVGSPKRTRRLKIYVLCSVMAFAMFANCIHIYQVVGHKEGLDVMERADPLFLLIGLPTIPVMLILGKMIRWEDYVLRLWRKYSNKLQILNSIFPGNVIKFKRSYQA